MKLIIGAIILALVGCASAHPRKEDRVRRVETYDHRQDHHHDVYVERYDVYEYRGRPYYPNYYSGRRYNSGRFCFDSSVILGNRGVFSGRYSDCIR